MSPLPACSWAPQGSAGLRWARFGSIRLGSAPLGSVQLAAPSEGRARCARRAWGTWGGGRPVGAGAGGPSGRPPCWEGGRRLPSNNARRGPGVRSGARPCPAGLGSPPHPGDSPGGCGGGRGAPRTCGRAGEERVLAGLTGGVGRDPPQPVPAPQGSVASPGARGQKSSRALGRDSSGAAQLKARWPCALGLSSDRAQKHGAIGTEPSDQPFADWGESSLCKCAPEQKLHVVFPHGKTRCGEGF